MSFDCHLVITDRSNGMLYVDHWLGQRGVMEEFEYVTDHLKPLNRAFTEGLEVYPVTPEQMIEICVASYAGGPDADEIDKYIQRYPTDSFHWMFVRKW